MSFLFPAALKWTIKRNSTLSKPGNTWAFLGLVKDVYHLLSAFDFISHNVIVIFFCEINIKYSAKNNLDNNLSLQNILTICCWSKLETFSITEFHLSKGQTWLQMELVRVLQIFTHSFIFLLPFSSLIEFQQLLLSTLPDSKPIKDDGNGHINFTGLWSRSWAIWSLNQPWP